MDIKLISVHTDEIKCHTATFVATVDNVRITGKAINRWQRHTKITSSAFILQLVFDNKEIIKHPKYKDIRTTLIKLLLEDTKDSYFALDVRVTASYG